MVSHQEQGRAGEILPSLGPFGVLLITVCWNEDLFGGTVIGTQSANSWQELHYRTNETKEMAGAEAERGLLAPHWPAWGSMPGQPARLDSPPRNALCASSCIRFHPCY